MISRQDIQRLLHQFDGRGPVLSVFLDMSVNAENKRTHMVYIQQQRGQHAELESERETHPREALGAAFERVERWLADAFDEANRGVAIYTGLEDDWLEGLQFPLALRNRCEIADQPVIGPLAQIVEEQRTHGVLVVDRAHLRMLAVALGSPLIEYEVTTEPYPTPHDVKRGGYSAKDFQKRKAEEVRHFFKEFALEVTEFDRRYRPDDLVVLGTDENVKRFLEFLPTHLRGKVIHTTHAPAVTGNAGILERLEPFFREQARRNAAAAIAELHDRVHQNHRATAGFRDTLERLQEGKVDTLVLARDGERIGSRCVRCGFYIPRMDSGCPYCGGELRSGVDLVEAMIRLAEEQEVTLAFVDAAALTDVDGVGALLKF